MSNSNRNTLGRSVVGRLALAAVTAIASIASVALLTRWAIGCFSPLPTEGVVSEVVVGSLLSLLMGMFCTFVARMDKSVGAVSFFFAFLFSLVMGVATVSESAQATKPGWEVCGFIMGVALAALTAAGAIVGYILAPIGKIMDDRSKH